MAVGPAQVAASRCGRVRQSPPPAAAACVVAAAALGGDSGRRPRCEKTRAVVGKVVVTVSCRGIRYKRWQLAPRPLSAVILTGRVEMVGGGRKQDIRRLQSIAGLTFATAVISNLR